MHLTHLNLGLVSFPPKTIHSPGFLSQWLASRGPDQKSKLPFRCFSPSHGTCQQLGSWSSQLAGSPAATPRRLPRRPQPLLCGCLSGLLIDPLHPLLLLAATGELFPPNVPLHLSPARKAPLASKCRQDKPFFPGDSTRLGDPGTCSALQLDSLLHS